MLSKKIFIALIFAMVLVIISFFLFMYNPKQEDMMVLQSDLQRTMNKFREAKQAESDLDNIYTEYDNQMHQLDLVKSRFINKNNLNEVTLKISEETKKFNLELLEFTPIFKLYFADTLNSDIKTLPFSIKVKGRFFEIGRFIENWDQFSFHIIPDEINLKRVSTKTNELQAEITGYLYAWSKVQE